MSITIPESYVEQFSANVHMLSEQQFSRLMMAVSMEDVTGESFARERIGQTADSANEVTQLHGDTPLNNTPHSRRWGFISDFDVADLIDKQSRVKLLIDPDSPYTRRHAGVMGRTIDDVIIEAALGLAVEGKSSGSAGIALPAEQKIAAASTGMTLDKLLAAKERLDEEEVDEFIPRYVAMSAKQMRNLLNEDKLTSADYATVKALVRGDLNEFLGFTFIRTERLPKVGDDRQCFAWAHDGILLGMAQRPVSEANTRPDKRNAKQIYTYGSWGAVRLEDEMVVQIDADET